MQFFAVTQCGAHTNHEAFKGLLLLLNRPRINCPHSLNQYSVVKQHQSYSTPFRCRKMYAVVSPPYEKLKIKTKN